MFLQHPQRTQALTHHEDKVRVLNAFVLPFTPLIPHNHERKGLCREMQFVFLRFATALPGSHVAEDPLKGVDLGILDATTGCNAYN